MSSDVSTVRKYIAIFSLGLCSAASFLLPFTRFYFYDQWVAAMGVTNEQAGYLGTFYAIANTILFIPGGWLADKFSPKKILVYSTLGTAFFNFLFAWNQNYYLAIFIWSGLAVTTAFGFWGGLMKAVRLCGTDNEQGKMYGWYNSGDGLFALIILNLAMFIYAHFSQDLGMAAGYRGALIFQGAACLLAALMVQIFFQDSLGGEVSSDDKMNLKDLGKVALNPATWYIALVIFCGYGLFTSSSYLTPYTTNALGVSAVLGGTLGIWRAKACRMVFPPIGGTLADWLKSSALVSVFSYIFIIAMLVILAMLPMENSKATIGIVVTFAFAAGMFMVYAVMFSSISEAQIPRAQTGTVIGLASILGYSSDYFFHPLFGRWMDQHGSAGYTRIFIFLIGVAVLGIIASLLVYFHGRKERAKAKAQTA